MLLPPFARWRLVTTEKASWSTHLTEGVVAVCVYAQIYIYVYIYIDRYIYIYTHRVSGPNLIVRMVLKGTGPVCRPECQGPALPPDRDYWEAQA